MDSIELLLDGASERFILGDWDALQDAGLPSRAAHTSPSNRPHITLVAAPALSDGQDDQLAGAFPLPLPLRFDGFVLFDAGRRGYVLARQVVCSAGLLQLHSSAHAAAGKIDSLASTTLPDAWVPHVTLANAIPADRLAEALGVLRSSMPEGRAVAARRWDSRARTVAALT